MSTTPATKAQIDYLASLQAQYLTDQAEGFFTQHATLEEHIAAIRWNDLLKSARQDFEAQITAEAPAWRQTPAELAKANHLAVWEPLAGQAREALAKAQTEGMSKLRAWRTAVTPFFPRVDALAQQMHWEDSKALNAAAHADLEGLTQSEASRLIDLLK